MLLSKSFLNDAKCELEDVVSKAEIEPEPVIINEDKKEEPEPVVEFEEEKEPEPVVELEEEKTEEKKEEVVPESPEPEPTSKDYTISKNCTFILQSGTRKGQLCGKPAKVEGLCGIHQKKNIPVQGELDPSKCDCMILSGARKGQACGRPIKENGLCAIHLKSCPTRASNIIEVSQQQSQIQPDKCPCLIQSGKNRNQVCGRSLQPGATTCKFHKEICTKSAITAPVEIVEAIEPEEVKEAEPEEVKEVEPEEVKEVEPESFESIDEAELEAQMKEILIEPDPDQEEESKELREPEVIPPDPIEKGDWTVIQVSEKELMDILDSTRILDIDTEQLSFLEHEIRRCFAY